MIKREMTKWLQERVSDPQVVQVQGLRQTGKTTLMDAFRAHFEGALHYPLFQLPVLQRYQAEPARWAIEVEQSLVRQKPEQGKPIHVFVDEIQKIPLLYQAIQGLYDTHKGRIKFWIWGSSARPTKRQRAETLAGRVFTKLLWPLAQSEVFEKESVVPHLEQPDTVIQHSVEEPRDYLYRLNLLLTQSGLPEAYLAPEGGADLLLESYQATYLENEVRRENLVKDIGLFQRFLVLAGSEDTQIVNYASKAKVLGISPITIQNYYHILEDTFVCLELPAYSPSLRVQLSKSPKIYFVDPGLARFMSGRRGELHPETREFGQMFEGFVVMELRKQIEYKSLPWRLFYFRTKTGVEVDLVIQTPEVSFAVEIEAARKVERQDWRPIEKLLALDPAIRFGIVISSDPRVGLIAPRIYHVPVWNL